MRRPLKQTHIPGTTRLGRQLSRMAQMQIQMQVQWLVQLPVQPEHQLSARRTRTQPQDQNSFTIGPDSTSDPVLQSSDADPTPRAGENSGNCILDGGIAP